MRSVFLLKLTVTWCFIFFIKLSPATVIPLFSPADHLKTKLIELIQSAKKKIHGAIYEFTDKDIAQAFVEAKERGVDVRLVADECEFNHAQIATLLNHEVPVFIFDNISHNKWAAIMHNKYVVFDEKIVWTGSYNFTIKANEKNQENAVIIYDKKIAREYERNYWYLRKLSKPLGTFADLLDRQRSKEPHTCCNLISTVLCLSGVCTLIYYTVSNLD